MTGREPTCRLGGCLEEGIEQVKSVTTVSVQTKLTLETKDTSFPHKANVLINKCNHGTHHIRAVTMQTAHKIKLITQQHSAKWEFTQDLTKCL